MGDSRRKALVPINQLKDEPFFRWSVLVYLVLRLFSFERGVQTLGDTPSYLHQASVPFLSERFFAGERSFTVPLLWKLVPGGTPADIAAQVVLSVISWLFLAFVVAAVVDHPVARRVGFWLVLGLSLTNVVITWDHDLLSESVTISLTAALLGCSLALVRRPTWEWLAATLVVAVLWVFARDSNAYAAVVAAPALVAVIALRPRWRAFATVALASVIALFAASLASAQVGGRSEQPVRDVIFIRLRVEDPSAMAWLQAHGFTDFNANNAALYRRYLLHHPLQVLAAPLVPKETSATYSSRNRITALWTPHVAQYDRNRFFARVPRQIQDLLFPLRPAMLGFELLIVCVAAAFAIRRQGFSAIWMLSFLALLSTYPQMVVVWNVSGQEIDRHALVPALVVRLAGVVLASLALDALLAPAREGSRSPQLRWPRLRTHSRGTAQSGSAART